ncbi:MAG: radical SAM protein [Thermodesulfobacteriota bacterium]|nr:radical SAM protein [Thermodesulfobacteriota bacterium]
MVPVTSLMRRIPRFPDLGLGYLATAIRNSGHNVSVRSWNMDPSVKDFKRYIQENSFDIIGIKVFTKDVAAAKKTIRIIQSVSPHTVIILGGPHPSTSEPEEVMSDFPESDFIFRGEAEIGLPLLIQLIGEKRKNTSQNLKGIPGLVWREGDAIHSNSPVFVSDMDAFGIPLWDLMTPKTYKAPGIPGGPVHGNTAPIIVTRGCSSRCTYCAAYKINGKKVRSRSAKAVVEEIGLLHDQYNVRHLAVMDTRFTQNEGIVTEICEGIVKNNLHIAWDCIGYQGLTSLNKDTLQSMKRAGCRFINVGIETGSDAIRKRIKKQAMTMEIFEKVQQIKDTGIDIRAFFMLGFPGETKRDIQETIDYAFSLSVESVQFDIVCPHPGTDLLGYLKERYCVEKIDWEKFDVYTSPYPLSEISSKELYRILKKVRRRIFFGMARRKLTGLQIIC